MNILSWLHDLTALPAESDEEKPEPPISPKLAARLTELGKMSVRDVMVPRSVVRALDADVQLRRVRRLKSSKFAYFPVYQGDLDHILGWISKQKVMELLNEPSEDLQLRDHLRPVGEVQENATVAELADAFLKNASPFLIVKNVSEATIGLVPLADFVELIFGFDLDSAPQPVSLLNHDQPQAPLLRGFEI